MPCIPTYSRPSSHLSSLLFVHEPTVPAHHKVCHPLLIVCVLKLALLISSLRPMTIQTPIASHYHQPILQSSKNVVGIRMELSPSAPASTSRNERDLFRAFANSGCSRLPKIRPHVRSRDGVQRP